MREIKFRAWEHGRKLMHGWDYFHPDNWGRILRNYKDEEEGKSWGEVFSPMQYTGIKDINENEIYEGDICLFQQDNVILPVEWSELHVGFAPWVYNIDSYDTYKDYPCEVIGNIYENPELLERP